MTGLLAFLVLIGVLITVHEFGHYIVAKAFGVKVEAFSVGFGSPIVQFKWGETEYKICWIPLGGYVRMLGQADYEMEDGAAEINTQDQGRAINEQTPFIRILIYAAGPAMNLILPFFIVAPFVALSDSYSTVPDNTVGAVDSSMPAGLAGLSSGDKIISINGDEVRAFWEIREAISEYNPAEGALEIGVNKAHLKQDQIVTVRPKAVQSTHPFLGYEMTRYQIGYQPAFLDSSIGFLTHDSPLYRAGLRSGDRVTKVNETSIDNMVGFAAALNGLSVGDTVRIESLRADAVIDKRFPFLREQSRQQTQFRVERPLDLTTLGVVHASVCIESVAHQGPAHALLQPGDCIVAVDGQRHSLGGYIGRALSTRPEQPKRVTFVRNGIELEGQLSAESYTWKDPMAGSIPMWAHGFTLPKQTMIPPQLIASERRWSHGWFEATTRVPQEIEDTLRTIGGMFSGGVSPSQLSGPLTMYHLADSSVRAGLESYLNLMVLLSLSIGLFNLLPIPLLDGGQIIIASIEWITRRPIPPQLHAGLQYVGLFMILMLLIFALGNDAVRTWRLTNG